MGDKAQAKAIMAAAGVPVVPGYHGEEQEQARWEPWFRLAGTEIGFRVQAASGDRVGFRGWQDTDREGAGSGFRR